MYYVFKKVYWWQKDNKEKNKHIENKPLVYYLFEQTNCNKEIVIHTITSSSYSRSLSDDVTVAHANGCTKNFE